MKKTSTAILLLLIATFLNAKSLEYFFDSLDREVNIGLIGVQPEPKVKQQVPQMKKQLLEIGRLKIERAITESVKFKSINLKYIIYNKTVCFPSDHIENIDAREDFYKKRSFALLKELAKVNNVDMIVYVQINRSGFLRYIKQDKTNYIVRISLYLSEFGSKNTQYIRIYDNMSQNQITDLVSTALTKNLQASFPSLL